MYRKWLPPLLAALFVIGTVTAILSATYRYWTHHRGEQLQVECAAAMKAQEWETLGTLADEWLQLDADNGFAWLYLGEAAQRREDFELTAKCLASLRDDDPKCVAALTELVELQLAKLNRPLDAVDTCQRILRLDPKTCMAHQRLVFFYAMTLQHRKMDEQILASIEAGCVSTDMLIYHFGGSSMRFSNGYKITTHWLEDDPESELFAVAQAIHLSKKLAAADATQSGIADDPLVRACIDKYPQNLEVLAHKLDAFISNGDLQKISRVLADAPADAQEDGRFWRVKGWLHGGEGHLDLARDAFQTALRLSPYDWRARHQYAGVLRRLGVTDNIEELTETAFEGKQLERALFELPTTADLPDAIRFQLIQHAKRVGDHSFASAIEAHFGANVAP